MATGSLNASARSKTAAVSPGPPLPSPAALLASSSGAAPRSPLRLVPLPRCRPGGVSDDDDDEGFVLLLLVSGGSLHSKQCR